MADQRILLRIPNCLNTLSNLPLALVGLLGLAAIFRRGTTRPLLFRDPWERWPYVALFAGATLTAFGSAYYHLAPDNRRLVWDRLPMTLGFMGLLTAVIAERFSLRVARMLFGPLLAFGLGSITYWHWRGDLRLYVFVQYGSAVVVAALLLLYRAPYSGAGYLLAALGAYAAAKGFEVADERIFALGQVVSGHTLKHLAAAGAVACIVQMLRARVRLAG
jgi:hypothetical protein